MALQTHIHTFTHWEREDTGPYGVFSEKYNLACKGSHKGIVQPVYSTGWCFTCWASKKHVNNHGACSRGIILYMLYNYISV